VSLIKLSVPSALASFPGILYLQFLISQYARMEGEAWGISSRNPRHDRHNNYCVITPPLNSQVM